MRETTRFHSTTKRRFYWVLFIWVSAFIRALQNLNTQNGSRYREVELSLSLINISSLQRRWIGFGSGYRVVPHIEVPFMEGWLYWLIKRCMCFFQDQILASGRSGVCWCDRWHLAEIFNFVKYFEFVSGRSPFSNI